MRNLNQLFVLCTASQIIGGDFAEFCGILNLLDYMIIFLELLFVDYGMEINVFVSNPLFGGYRQYIVPSDHLQSHSGNVVDSKFYIRHFCKEKSLSMID